MGGKPNRLLTYGVIALAACGAIYLWIINIAILRDGDKRRIEELQLELMAARDAFNQASGDNAFLSGAAIALLKPNDKVAAAKRAGGVVMHRGASLFVAARQLPPPPKGKAYALWAYFDGKPVAAGEFQPGPDGALRGRHTLKRDLAPVEGFMISLETAGGVDSPAGPVFLTRP